MKPAYEALVGLLVICLAALQLIFIPLKLIGSIEWNWFFVFCPIWIPLIVVGCIMFISYIIILSFKK